MNYDYGRKYISKKTGLTGIESMNIARSLSKKQIDFQTVDWETIGQDMYGHGKRTGGVKHHLKEMYGISLDDPITQLPKYKQQAREYDMMELRTIFDSRSKRSKMIDLHINAKRTFKHTNKKGVEKWRKNPNQYDIIGIDDIP